MKLGTGAGVKTVGGRVIREPVTVLFDIDLHCLLPISRTVDLGVFLGYFYDLKKYKTTLTTVKDFISILLKTKWTSLRIWQGQILLSLPPDQQYLNWPIWVFLKLYLSLIKIRKSPAKRSMKWGWVNV